jgi:hypothetical protein
MPGLAPRIHDFSFDARMAGTFAGHDEVEICGNATKNSPRGILTMELDAASNVYPYWGQRRSLP